MDAQRQLTRSFRDDLGAATLEPVMFVDLAFRPLGEESQRLFVHNHIGTFTWGHLVTSKDTGDQIISEFFYPQVQLPIRPQDTAELKYTISTVDWIGIGDFGKVDNFEESEELSNLASRFVLSGVDRQIVDRVLRTDYYRRSVNVYMANLDTSSANLLLNSGEGEVPDNIWSGFMDYIQIIRNEDTQDVVLIAENEDADFYRPNGALYSNVQQQLEYPGDRGFEFLEELEDRTVLWPGSAHVKYGQQSRVRSYIYTR